MAVPLTEFRKRQRILFLVFVVLFVLVGAIFWFGFYGGGVGVPEGASVPVAPATISFNFSLFEDPVFEALDPPSAPLAMPEDFGRENPFVPY
ncbi:MAG: hypothetical protein ABIB12_01975 [Patescibacteria group bacterium]